MLRFRVAYRGIPFVPAVLSTRPAFTLQIATLSSALVIAGAFPIPTVSLLTPYAFANRAMALITIWVTAILVRNYRQRIAKTARLAALVTSSDDAILSTTLEGKIETWNAGAEHLCAYQRRRLWDNRSRCYCLRIAKRNWPTCWHA